MRAGRAARLRARLWAWAPALCTMAAIWVLSSSGAPGIPVHALPFQDRGAHFLAYATLAFLVAHGVLAQRAAGDPWIPRPRVWLFAVYTAVLWGLLDEVHQSFVPGRSPDLVDLAADTLGGSIGALGRVILSRRPLLAPSAASSPSEAA